MFGMEKKACDKQPEAQRHGIAARPGFVCAVLGVLTLAVFWPAKAFNFISLDDPDYVTANPYVQHGLSWEGVAWSFRIGYAHNWHPLTWLSHLLDGQLFGPGAAGPHLENVLFHACNALVLFLFLREATGAHWRSALVAGFFALHPLHVESVAWISERKDVLSTLFGLLALWAYARWVKKREGVTGHPRYGFQYWLALAFFALGLMSKPMLVTVPFLMLLLDFWPLGRMIGLVQTPTVPRVAADVRRRRFGRFASGNPPPHVGGYGVLKHVLSLLRGL